MSLCLNVKFMRHSTKVRRKLWYLQDLGVMEAILPAADMQRWVAARSKPKYAALMMTQIIRHAQVGV